MCRIRTLVCVRSCGFDLSAEVMRAEFDVGWNLLRLALELKSHFFLLFVYWLVSSRS